MFSRIIHFLFAFTILLGSSACGSSGKEGVVIIEGELPSYVGDTLIVGHVQPWVYGIEARRDSVILQDDGNFTFTLKEEMGNLYYLKSKDQFLTSFFIESGQVAELFELDSIVVLTEGIVKSNKKFLDRFNDLYSKNGGTDSLYGENMLALNTEDFKAWVLSHRKEMESRVEENLAQKSSIPFFKKFMKMKVEAISGGQLLQYIIDHPFYNQLDDDMVDVDWSWILESSSSLFEDDFYARFNEYSGFVQTYQNQYRLSLYYLDSVKSRIKQYQLCFDHLKEIQEPECRNQALVTLLSDLSETSNSEKDLFVLDSFITVFKGLNPEPRQLDYLSFRRKKLEEKIQGRPFPDLSFLNPEGDSIRILDEFASLNVIYLWGTWCKPCIEKVPEYNKLITEYQDNPEVKFFNIALESDRFDRWKTFLSKNEFLGTQLYAEGNFKSDIAQYFEIKSAPNFVVVDRNQTVIMGPGYLDLEQIEMLLSSAK